MVAKKPITCAGNVYQSVIDLAKAFGVHQSTVARRLRDGWTPEQSVGIESKPRLIGHGTEVSYQGRWYPHLAALAVELRLDPRTFRARIARGYSIEEAAQGKMRPRKSGQAKVIDVEGRQFSSQTELATAYGLEWSVVSKRLNRGWTMRQALGLDSEPPRFRDHEGHARDSKWKHTRSSLSGLEPVPDSGGYKIYLIKNHVNGKQYVGLTVGSLESRLKQHFAAARKGRKAPLPNAIRKYGEDAFSIELIRSDAISYEQLQDQEINEIATRGTIGNGYNSAIGGAVGITKPITVQGRKFPSRAQAAEFFGIDIGVFNLRIGRLKWSAEEAAGLVERSWSGKDISISVNGMTYPSIRQAALAFQKDFKKVYDRYSEKGWTIEQALDLAPPPETVKFVGSPLTVNGVQFPSVAAAANAHGIQPESLRRRLLRGESPEAAIDATLKRVRRKPEQYIATTSESDTEAPES